MGSKLAKDHRNSTNEFCNLRQVYIICSASEWSIESVSALFTRFCPPSGRWIWCDEPSCKDAAKYWQPIAIQTVDKAKDNLFNVFAPCKVAENAVNQIVKSKEVQDYLRENREFIEKVGQVTGSFKSYNESSTLWNLTDIVDTVMAEMENGKNITEFKYKFGKFNQTVFDKLNEILLKSFKWEYSTKQV